MIIRIAGSPGRSVERCLDNRCKKSFSRRNEYMKERDNALRLNKYPHHHIMGLDGFVDAEWALIYHHWMNTDLGRVCRLADGGPCRLPLDYFGCIATAIHHMHMECKMVHNDLKPDNILVGDNGPYIIDFGSACSSNSAENDASLPVGARPYLAPEARCQGPQRDIWAFGIVLVDLQNALAGRSRDEFRSRYFQHGELQREVLYAQLDDLHCEASSDTQRRDLVKLTRWCLQYNPAARPDSAQVLDFFRERLPTYIGKCCSAAPVSEASSG